GRAGRVPRGGGRRRARPPARAPARRAVPARRRDDHDDARVLPADAHGAGGGGGRRPGDELPARRRGPRRGGPGRPARAAGRRRARTERLAARYEVAVAARREVEARKRAMPLLDYDDLLVLLRRALTDPEHGETAAQRVRSRFRVVMVDEFQDTDPEQWEILRTAFHGHRTL